MKNITVLLLALALGTAVFASADELDTLIYKLRGITPPKEAPTPASLERHRQAGASQEALSEKLAIPKDESNVPVGSLPSPCAGNLLQSHVSEDGTNTFPVESQNVCLQDQTMKVIVPETPTPTSAIEPTDSKLPPVIVLPPPVATPSASD